ncbi:hypothetical protein GCM10023188_37460 [Pontibacter saemangeumensis]|uniref:DUF2255 family protein n=1 Tax=Pontibacter saemangeumensis TaxID=1084525 RepID=A0ABP8M0N4_9BACT
MAPTDHNLIHYINTHNLIGIKAGKERDTFLNIWMVTCEDRIFARSWGLAERSWYNTFRKDEAGELKCGDQVYKIKGVVPADLERMNAKINQAYLAKYDAGANAFYAHGITKPEHTAKTMEFIPV